MNKTVQHVKSELHNGSQQAINQSICGQMNDISNVDNFAVLFFF